MGFIRSTTVPAAALALALALAGCTGTEPAAPAAATSAPATSSPATEAASPSAAPSASEAPPSSSSSSPSASPSGPASGTVPETSLSPSGATTSPDPATASPTPAGTALAALQDLPVKGRAPKTGYDRLQFGPAWADTDHNGCDTRNDMLARDLTEETFRPGTHDCVVLSGVLDDPYTATEIHFLRGQDTSTDVQVDHVVALSDAWQKGAQQLDADERTAFANDPLNLLAVDGPANAQKGDGDAATWLPANVSFRCDYVARQVAVKAEYALWVTAAERDAMAGVLETCPGQELPTAETAATAYEITTRATQSPTPTAAAPSASEPTGPGPTATPSPDPEQDVTDPRFSSCTRAKAAGYGPYVAGTDPEYDWYRDGDGDGITCE